MGIRERLDTLSRGELAGLILVVVVTLGGAGLWYARSLPKPVALAASPALPAALGIRVRGGVEREPLGRADHRRRDGVGARSPGSTSSRPVTEWSTP